MNDASENNSTGLDWNSTYNHGVALLDDKQYSDARKVFSRLLKFTPNDTGTWCNLGIALKALKYFDAALTAAARSVELSPSDPVALMNYDHCLLVLDSGDEAMEVYARAAQIAPTEFDSILYYALSLREFGNFDDALTQIDIACALHPENTYARWQRSITLLHLGRFHDGWEEYELRLNQKTRNVPDYSSPRWHGQNLSGKTILTFAEQGFGDTLLCSRYIPLVKNLGARVLFGCKEPLHRLFQKLPSIDRVVEPGPLGRNV